MLLSFLAIADPFFRTTRSRKGTNNMRALLSYHLLGTRTTLCLPVLGSCCTSMHFPLVPRDPAHLSRNGMRTHHLFGRLQSIVEWLLLILSYCMKLSFRTIPTRFCPSLLKRNGLRASLFHNLFGRLHKWRRPVDCVALMLNVLPEACFPLRFSLDSAHLCKKGTRTYGIRVSLFHHLFGRLYCILSISWVPI